MFPLLPFPTPGDVVLFALVLCRVAGIFAALPAFGGQRLPRQIRAVAVFAITLVCLPVLRITPPAVPVNSIALALLMAGEVLVGLMLSFISQALFSAVEFCGQVIGMQMGFTISQILDPTMGNQAQLMSVLQTLLATLLFLSLNIHHLFLGAIADSFRIVPVGGWHVTGEIINFLVRRAADIFVLGIRLAAPVMVALLMTSVALGIMSRAFPQMNIFMLSLPLNIGIGFVILGATLLIFFHVLEVSFGQLKGHVDTLFRLMGKGG
jgi:flagellar biosynthetic protein FliR